MHLKLKQAVNYLIFQEPFFGSLLPRLEFIENPNIETLATNGKAIFWNKDYVEQQQILVVRADVLHEIGHCIFGHMYRCMSRDLKKWNVSCDYAINPLIKQVRNILVDDTFLLDEIRFPAGMTAERIYDKLPDCTNLKVNMDVLPAPGDATKTDEIEWRGAVALAATNAKKAGLLSSALEQIINTFLDPKIPWKQLLYTWMSSSKQSYTSWQKPNKRYLPHGLYLPGKRKSPTGIFVIWYDTSGSMSDIAVKESLTEIRFIINEVKPKRVILGQHDSKITDVQEYETGDELPTEIKICGRGGTDFNPAFKYVNQLDEIPDAVIMFTDGYGPHPNYPPEYPVLWVMVKTDHSLRMNFGEQIWLDP